MPVEDIRNRGKDPQWQLKPDQSFVFAAGLVECHRSSEAVLLVVSRIWRTGGAGRGLQRHESKRSDAADACWLAETIAGRISENLELRL